MKTIQARVPEDVYRILKIYKDRLEVPWGVFFAKQLARGLRHQMCCENPVADTPIRHGSRGDVEHADYATLRDWDGGPT